MTTSLIAEVTFWISSVIFTVASFVWEAISQLPVAQREIIHLFYQEGYSAAQIAAIVGRRESTVRSDLTRARKRLKTILKEAYDFA